VCVCALLLVYLFDNVFVFLYVYIVRMLPKDVNTITALSNAPWIVSI